MKNKVYRKKNWNTSESRFIIKITEDLGKVYDVKSLATHNMAEEQV